MTRRGWLNRGGIAAAFVAACGLLSASAAVANPPGLDVRLSVPAPVLQGDVDVRLTVTLTNTTRHPIQLLKWQLPDDEIESALFRIKREDGSTVRYEGPIVKRAAPQAQDHVRIEAGATLSYTVELTASYDLSRSGRYSIEYASPGGHGAQATLLRSEPIYLWLEGRNGKGSAPPAPPVGSAQPIYSSCSASQQSDLTAATSQAVSYSSAVGSYLAGTPSGTPRYIKWFGSYSSTGWGTAKSHFSAIHSAFTTQNLAFDCKCKKPSTYAYVYANQPYKIYLCGAFWKAPLGGTDSRGGTLIHEMSHFTVVASTDDWAYGQAAASNLAATDPAKALDNADSHEYFAENTPALD
ncbi:MAG: M35 family metallo-endopeptidase [Burkholderiaceae bacterium]